MELLLALVIFLVGAGLGISVRRQASRHAVADAAASVHPDSSSAEAPAAADGEVRASIEDSLVVLRSALDALPAGVVVANRTGVITFKNVAAAAMTGVRHVDVLVEEAAEVLLTSTLTGGETQRLLQTSGQPTRSFDLRGRRLLSGGGIVTIEDVTERMRIDTVRTDFVANLSHELKTPIGGIAALADAMVDETDPQVLSRFADRIVSEAYRLSRTVDDLLDLSRIEFGGAEHWEAVDMSLVVNEVTARMQHESARTGVVLKADCPKGVYVKGDRNQLVSAVANLVENAIKYSGDGKLVQLLVKVADTSVSIEVIDQGIGIAAKDQQRIFERFYRVDRARSRATGGSGLGLSIVRHVIAHHGGTVSVMSEEGRGATFTVVLPRHVSVDYPGTDHPATPVTDRTYAPGVDA
jgi:two-component system sensor histidine kinase SenX3